MQIRQTVTCKSLKALSGCLDLAAQFFKTVSSSVEFDYDEQCEPNPLTSFALMHSSRWVTLGFPV